MQGIVQLVTVRPGGGFPTSPSAVGSSSISFADASDFEEGGGQVSIDGTVLDYVSADLDLDVVYLAAPLSFEVGEETFVANHPPTTETFASVALDDDIVEAEVPHSLKPLLPEGPRDPEDGEAVILEMDRQGSWSIKDVVGSRAAIDAVYVDNADELLLEDMKTLGEKLSEAAAERAAAAGRLDAAEGLLGDAFDQIDLKSDQAYVDAAKQQAIDAAAIDAQAKADAAEGAAVAAAATDATTKASQALTDAKAFATTQTDGVAKSVWSAALPGTTRLPQNSTWYQHDSAGNIIAVFNQTAASSGTTHGNTWVARPITSEAIDKLDVGKLSVSGTSTLQQAVINQMAVQLATIIQADIGNLTVTGESSLNTVVAERIGANVAAFVQITAQQILSGSLQATISVVAGGIIVAGDPDEAAVELTADGITIWDWTEEDGRFVTTKLGGAGSDSLEITDATGHVIAGFSSEGNVTGQTAAITNDITVGGRPILGRLGPNPPTGDDAEASWLEEMPRGVVAWRDFQDRKPTTSTGRATGEEWGYAAIEADVVAGRLYRITVIVHSVSYVTGGIVRWRLRASQGSPAKTDSTLLHADESAPAVSPTWALYGQLIGYWAPTEDGVLSTLVTYGGREGATPQMRYATFTIEDIGLAGDPASGGYTTGGAVAGTGGTQPPPTAPPEPVKKTYTSTWEASGFQAYYGNGNARDSSGELVQGYTSYYPAGGINTSLVNFNGNAISGETGKSMSAALSGATITKVEIRLRNVHWHSSQGGRAQLMKKTGSSLPNTHQASSFTSGKTYPSSGYWSRGAAMWVTVPTDWFSATNRMFAIGANNTSSTFYGRFVGTGSERPRVRITYTR